jgi:hypothetical protein
MSSWAIFDYLADDGADDIRIWIDSLPKKAQAKTDTLLRYLEVTEIWPAQYLSDRKDCEGIYEIRIVSAGVQLRPLGYFGPRRREFTILLGAVEKGGRLEPREFCRISTRRREIVNGNRNRITPHRFG